MLHRFDYHYSLFFFSMCVCVWINSHLELNLLFLHYLLTLPITLFFQTHRWIRLPRMSCAHDATLIGY